MAENVAPVATQAHEQHEGFCPFCGEPNPSRAVFCAGCGQRLPAGAAAGARAQMPVPAPTPTPTPGIVGAQQADRLAEALPGGGIPRRTAAFLIDVAIIITAAAAYDTALATRRGTRQRSSSTSPRRST